MYNLEGSWEKSGCEGVSQDLKNIMFPDCTPKVIKLNLKNYRALPLEYIQYCDLSQVIAVWE